MERKVILTKNAPAPIGPYSQAIKVGNTLYASGQIAINPKTGILVNQSIEEECHQVLRNVGAVLEEAGMSYSNVVKVSIFLADMDQFGLINEVYATYFTEEASPARETVEVARLPKDVNVEISVIAIDG